MTRGYFVLEQSGTVVKAAYLPADAYLQYGHGQEIVKAYAEGNEMEKISILKAAISFRVSSTTRINSSFCSILAFFAITEKIGWYTPLS